MGRRTGVGCEGFSCRFETVSVRLDLVSHIWQDPSVWDVDKSRIREQTHYLRGGSSWEQETFYHRRESLSSLRSHLTTSELHCPHPWHPFTYSKNFYIGMFFRVKRILFGNRTVEGRRRTRFIYPSLQSETRRSYNDSGYVLCRFLNDFFCIHFINTNKMVFRLIIE